MTIIKKSGKTEDFSAEKLSVSIASASDEAGSPLNESDLNSIVSAFLDITKGKSEISTTNIDIIICGILYSRGYQNTLKSYSSFVKKKKI